MRRFSLSGLRVRLLILVLIAAIPAFGVFLYTALEGRQIAAAQGRAEALRIARLISANQTPAIDGARQLLVALARLPQVRGGDAQACSTLLAELLTQYPRYANLGVVKPNGDVLCSGIPAKDPVNYADRDWFKRAGQSHDFAIGEFMVGQISGKSVLHLAQPAFDAEGELELVVYASLDLVWLEQVVTQLTVQVELPEGGTICIIDRNGTLLGHYPHPDEWLGRSFLNPSIVQTVLARGEGSAETIGGDGVARLHAFTPIGSAANPDGYVSVGLPSALAYAEVNWLIERDLAALALVTLLALAAAWMGGDVFVLRPVSALVNAAKRLKSGDLRSRTGLPHGRGEMGLLARAFDEMAESLENHSAERSLAEEKIQQQTRFLETVIESLAYPFYVIDAEDYTIKIANKAARHAPLPEDATCYAVVHNSSRPCGESGTQCPLDQVKKTKKPVTLEHTHYNGTSDTRAVQVYGSPIFDANGNVLQVIEQYVDITEHRFAEQALAAEKERLAITLRSIGDGVITTDAEKRIVLFNVMAEQLSGWTQAQAVGRPLSEVFPIINVKTREVIQDPVSQVLESATIVGLAENTALITKDGTERIISSSVAPMRDGTGRITGAVLVFRDITRLKQAEEALRNSQEFARNLIDSSLDMIIAVDQDRRIVEFNKAAQKVFGYRREEILGKQVSILYANAQQGNGVHKTIMESGQCVQEVWNRRKNGQVFPSLLSASELKDARGAVVGVMGVSRDITERKKAEEQHTKAERLAALGRMAAALAHEINNPLQAIQGTLELALDFPLGAEERERNFRIIRQEMERLSEVTRRVLEFARPAQVPRRLVFVDELLEQTLELAAKQLQHARIVVTKRLAPLSVPAAPEQLTQVFLNLVLNAIDAMHSGGHLDISARAEADLAVVQFADDGPSIAPEVMPHIFEPFFTTKVDGSGLGLSVSHSLVQQHGGTITVENLEGKRGVVFTVRLPLASPQAETKR